MCIHRFYIFEACGHYFFAPNPLVACKHASARNGGPLTPVPVSPGMSQYLPITAQMKRTHAAPLKQVTFLQGGQPGCEPIAHPFQTFKLDATNCRSCQDERMRRVEEADALLGRVCFDESKWKSGKPGSTKLSLARTPEVPVEGNRLSTRELRYAAQQAHTQKRISQSSALSISPIDEMSMAVFEESIDMEAGRSTKAPVGHARQVSESRIPVRKGNTFRNSVLAIESSLYKFGESLV